MAATSSPTTKTAPNINTTHKASKKKKKSEAKRNGIIQQTEAAIIEMVRLIYGRINKQIQ